ncbi:MAG TPA: hypothetical protein QGF04_03980 [Woeseiaceae bacterium]|nr:hypothetical protein [Woeseiaceae bacterium]
MTELGILKLIHILCLVYWLGADLGVFYSSYFLVNEELPRKTRITISKILFFLDQSPRISMILIFPSGIHLSKILGYLDISYLLVSIIWIVASLWLALVIVLHIRSQSVKNLAALDYWLRVSFATAMIIAVAFIIMYQPEYTWAGKKIFIFSLTVICGLIIRHKLRMFEPAFIALIEEKETRTSNLIMKESIASSRPFVVFIWVCLLLNTSLGLHLIQVT